MRSAYNVLGIIIRTSDPTASRSILQYWNKLYRQIHQKERLEVIDSGLPVHQRTHRCGIKDKRTLQIGRIVLFSISEALPLDFIRPRLPSS